MQGNTREINEREAKRTAKREEEAKREPWPIGNEAGITLGDYERLHEAKREAMLQEAMAKSREAKREANEREAVRSFVQYHTAEREANERKAEREAVTRLNEGAAQQREAEREDRMNVSNERIQTFYDQLLAEREAMNEANEHEAGSGLARLIERQEITRQKAFSDGLDLAIDEAVAASRLALRDMLEVSIEDLLFTAVNEALQRD